MLRQDLALIIEELLQPRLQLRVKRVIAHQAAMVKKADAKFDVLIVELRTFRDGPHGLAYTKPAVPERLQKRRNLRPVVAGRLLACHKKADIDVGIGEQFASAKAAYGQYGKPGGHGSGQMP
jgi:hypothetical protein